MLADRLNEINSVLATNPVTKDDVLNEIVKGKLFLDIDLLSSEQVAAILASTEKSVQQDADEITVNGIGTYGISIEQMQQLGIVKPHIDSTGDPATILSDASVFTGRESITSIDNITSNTRLQNRLLQKSMQLTIDKIVRYGTEINSVDEATILVGAATKYNTSDILGWIKTTDAEINTVAKNAHYAVAMINSKVTDEAKALQAALTGAIVKTPTSDAGSIDDSDAVTEYNALIAGTGIPQRVSEYIPKDSGNIF
jgi:hypothetical protein